MNAVTRHFLLMTATPHHGKEEDFQLFMSLLDSDRFYGKFRDGAHKVDVADLMRRMVKEPDLPPDAQDKRSVIPIELDDVEQWLHGSLDDATSLLKLAPVEVFDAGPVSAAPQSPLL